MIDLILAFTLLVGPHNDIAEFLGWHPEANTVVVEAAAHHDVPPALLFTVGIFESGMDSNRPNGGPFGMNERIEAQHCRRPDAQCAPRTDRANRFARNAEAASIVLMVGRKSCGSWRGAASYLRTGKCGLETDLTHYGLRAIHMAHALERHLPRGTRSISQP